MTELLPGLSTRLLGIAAWVLAGLTITGIVLLAGPSKLPGRDPDVALPMRSLGARPGLQLQLAPSDADIATVLATKDKTARDTLVKSLRDGKRLDDRLFIPSYALFLVALTLLMQRGGELHGRKIIVVLLCVIPLIAVLDWIENRGIAHAVDLLEGGQPLVYVASWISWPALAKWKLLAGVMIVLGAIGLLHSGWRLGAGAALVLVGTIVTVQIVRYAAERLGFG